MVRAHTSVAGPTSSERARIGLRQTGGLDFPPHRWRGRHSRICSTHLRTPTSPIRSAGSAIDLVSSRGRNSVRSPTASFGAATRPSSHSVTGKQSRGLSHRLVVARYASGPVRVHNCPDDQTCPCDPLAVHQPGSSQGIACRRITLDDEWYMGSGGKELVAFGRKPADHDQAAVQGIHALDPLIGIDGPCGVPKSIFDARRFSRHECECPSARHR
jgi:hypothetical protein